MKGKWVDERNDESRRWKDNKMRKEIMKAEDERRIRWWKECWTEKIKWEWVGERNDECRRWKENKMRKEMMKAEDERRIRWGKK